MSEDTQDGAVTVDLPDTAMETGREPLHTATQMPGETREQAPAHQRQTDSDSPAAGIEDLKRQLAEATRASDHHRKVAEEEGRRRQEAERAAQDYAGQATAANSVASQREHESLLNAISATQQGIDKASADLRQAMEAGDYDKASQAQIAIGRFAARLEQMESGRASAEEARKAAPVQTQPPRQQPAPAAVDWSRAWSPTEAESVARGSSPAAAAWMRSHPQFFHDPNFRQQVIGADQVARARGIAPDTDAYFQAVEGIVGISSPEATAQQMAQMHQPAPVQGQQRQAPPPAAAPSRQVPSSGGQASSGNRVTLSADECDIARFMFPNEKDPLATFAANKQACEREGRYDSLTGRR